MNIIEFSNLSEAFDNIKINNIEAFKQYSNDNVKSSAWITKGTSTIKKQKKSIFNKLYHEAKELESKRNLL